MNKKDFILIIALIVLSVGGLITYRLVTTPSDDSKTEIVITKHGEEFGRYSINSDQTIEIPADVGTNVLVIKDKKAKMERAGCPDQICVKHSAISYNHDMIVCLPNEIIVEVVGGVDSLTDVIAK